MGVSSTAMRLLVKHRSAVALPAAPNRQRRSASAASSANSSRQAARVSGVVCHGVCAGLGQFDRPSGPAHDDSLAAGHRLCDDEPERFGVGAGMHDDVERADG